jgi:TIR domain
MDEIRIFISYTQEDQRIADALKTLFEQALGSAVDVFLDKTSIAFGGAIKDKIVDGLQHADVLVALIAGGQPASALNWIGWEVGTFEAAWRERTVPKDLSNTNIIGQVVVLCNEGASLGPELGNRPVELGIPSNILPDPGTEDYDKRLRAAARSQTELLKLVQDMEKLVKNGEHEEFFKGRDDSLDDLVTDFKVKAFEELKGRIIHESKPTKHVVIRFSGSAMRDDYFELPDKSTLSFSDQTSSVFGLDQSQRSLFRKVGTPPTHVARYETTWGQFKVALKVNRYGAYWLGVIEQALIAAKRGDAPPETGLVIVAHNERLHRVVATTVTTFFNNDSEVSLYLVEALQRLDHGEEATSNLLNGVTIVCRFRFAFLEAKSDFYYKNFPPTIGTPRAKAKELLMELDYLRSEAIHANLDKLGMWEPFMDKNRFDAMTQTWKDVDLKLRGACAALIAPPRDATTSDVAGPVSDIVVQLKRIHEEIRPFNAELGQKIAREMEAVFKDGKRAWASQKEGKETPQQAATSDVIEGTKN